MRQKRSLSQTNTSAKDCKNAHYESETQVDVNEIERELLSRDHNLPGTSSRGFIQPQEFTSKVQEHRSKLKSALRKRKNLAHRRPASCDSAQPRKRQCSRTNSRSKIKIPCKLPTTPTEGQGTSLSIASCRQCTPSSKVSAGSVPNSTAVSPRETSPSSIGLLHQRRDDNENAPRYSRSYSSSSLSSSKSYFKPHQPRYIIRRLTPRKRISRPRLPRKKSRTGIRKVPHSGRITTPSRGQKSRYCITPSPGRMVPQAIYRKSVSPRSRRRRSSTRYRISRSQRPPHSRYTYRTRTSPIQATAPRLSHSDSFFSRSDSDRTKNRDRSRSQRRHDYQRQDRSSHHYDRYYSHERSPVSYILEEKIPNTERERSRSISRLRSRSQTRSRTRTRSADHDHLSNQHRSARKRRKTRSISNSKSRKKKGVMWNDADNDGIKNSSRKHKKPLETDAVMTPNRRYLCLLM